MIVKEVISEAGKASLLMGYKKNKVERLINELKVGEESGFIAEFDRQQMLDNLHAKYLTNEL